MRRLNDIEAGEVQYQAKRLVEQIVYQFLRRQGMREVTVSIRLAPSNVEVLAVKLPNLIETVWGAMPLGESA